jgi:Mn2+/Fe2+ NRAMP family transporter
MAAPVSAETRTGLDPWLRAEMPAPPMPSGLGWLGVVGPGVIMLGISIGSGEFLLGPAAFLKHGLALLWVSLAAIFFQAVLNLEVMRYVLATGEPVFSGFMRTRPSATGWAWFYSLMFVLQMGWPAWAAISAGAIFYLFAGQLPSPADGGSIHMIGIATYFVCVSLLLMGRRIGRTLELLNWVMVVVTLGAFLIGAIVFVPAKTWLAAVLGFGGFDARNGHFAFLPEGADLFLIGALVAYSGCGGMMNFALGNWARDKGYGMSQHAGYIPALIGGERMNLAHHGFTFTPDAQSLSRWRGWWRIVHADQWGVFFVGALLGMALPALLYVTFLPHGSEIRGLGISAALAESVGQRTGPVLAGAVAILGVWLLFKTQLDTIEGMTRTITDILWSGSARVRRWRGGDVRAVYYSVLALVVIWGVIALGLAAPIMLLQISANIAGVVFVVAALHLLYVNTRLLPPALRPPLWRRLALVAMSLFYSFFVVLAASSFW